MIFRRRFDRFRCLDQSRCSKTIEKIIRVSKGLHKEMDAFLFLGPEQFSADAPLILLLCAKMIFRRRFDRLPMPRSIEVLENDRKKITGILLSLYSTFSLYT